MTNMDNAIKQYDDLKKIHPNALLLFRSGDVYVTYKKDAEVVSNILGVTSYSNSDNIRVASFTYLAIDIYLPKLTRRGYRVAICEQIETNVVEQIKPSNLRSS